MSDRKDKLTEAEWEKIMKVTKEAYENFEDNTFKFLEGKDVKGHEARILYMIATSMTLSIIEAAEVENPGTGSQLMIDLIAKGSLAVARNGNDELARQLAEALVKSEAEEAGYPDLDDDNEPTRGNA